MKLKHTLASAATLMALAGAALAQTTLSIQTAQSESSPTGELIGQFKSDIETMSGGSLKVDMYYSSALVDTASSFDSAANGVLSCDFTNASYLTGKNPAFQFASDMMGGYDTPYQQLSWLYYGGGKQVLNKLYQKYGMTFVGWHTGGQESLSSTRPIKTIKDLKEFKFRSPPGMESDIFAKLGAKPVVMDFTEIFSALETGIIDGADASYLANNKSLGIYDIAKYTTFPGFHSMSADHLACNSGVWNSLTDTQRAIIDTAMQKLALQVAMRSEVENRKVLDSLTASGVTVYDWSTEDRAAFRKAARETWEEWAKKSPETKALVDSHIAHLKRLRLIKEQ
ncbi:TRAP transporter substrate-binding protein [Pseudomonas sp. M30-35]|uniref:TRAP transporter substrate-binding protein n=1 Tax=Pseudomonas sp. M30-35 TaxID=1981174 RepID=UPI000B3D4E94|nr:TRAP transporter substrate-binding protein [Pseudomonas sp. M30-35]ARU90140.1 C4-dicarboxylate ABC transporter substrate-binding protein [Pseudomonas sp. M30-35]